MRALTPFLDVSSLRRVPHKEITPKPRLRLAYSGPPIVKTPADVLAIIRARCADILTDAEIALVIKVPAIEGPAKPKAKAAKPAPKAAAKGRKSR